MPARVQSLFQISQAVCIKQAARITDVGDTPYHLISPILKRLNAKQLAHLEENSPSVMPHSDECWGSLIEKDFPDRPFSPAKLRLLRENAQMPRKALYKQYSDEKEQFLATSADRLRKMTEKLRREKSKNSITTVQGVLADPTIRRRVPQTFSSRAYNTSKPRPRSILGKAMRDVSHRSLMFGGGPKQYDPYKAFHVQNRDQSQKGQIRTNGPYSVGASRTVTRSPSKVQNHSSVGRNLGQLDQKVGQKVGPTVPLQMNNIQPQLYPSEPQQQEPLPHQQGQQDQSDPHMDPPQVESPEKTKGESPQGVASIPPHLRKRRPPPSIFLQRKKPRNIKSPAGPGTKKSESREKSDVKPEEHRPVKAIKSSIFN